MTSSPRKTLLLSVHSAARGGAELMALAEAQHLATRFDLVIAVPEGPLRDAFAQCGQVVEGSPRLPLYGAGPARWASRLARTAADARRLASLIRRAEVELVLVNSLVSLSPLVAARVSGVPAVVNPRYDASQAHPSPWRSLWAPVVRCEGALADVVIAISKGIEQEFAGARRARVVPIPDGIEIPEHIEAAASFGRPVRLVMIGGIERVKSQDVALEALGLLHARGVDTELELIGRITDPAFADELKARAAALGVGDNLTLRGEIAGVGGALADADILLHTSRGEATPLILMEALAHRKPVVTTRVGGIPRIVQHGETGLLTAPGDASAVADAVQQLLADPGNALAMGALGRERIQARFDRKRTLAQLEGELEHLLLQAAQAA